MLLYSVIPPPFLFLSRSLSFSVFLYYEFGKVKSLANQSLKIMEYVFDSCYSNLIKRTFNFD